MGHLTVTGDHVEAATNSAISLRNAITR
jgi:hypothetical protein